MHRRNHGIIRTHRSRRGAVMAEFAVVLLIFVLAMIGIIEFGRAIMVQQMLVNAAREGARRAIVPGATNSQVTALVNDYLDNVDNYVRNASNRQVAIVDENGNAVDLATASSHSGVAVVVSVPYNEVGVGISPFLTGSTMTSVVQMRKE